MGCLPNRPGLKLAIYCLFFVAAYGSSYGFDILSSILLSKTAAVTLASYGVVRSTVYFVIGFFRFITAATRAMVSRKHAAGEYKAVGAIVRTSMVWSLSVGLFGFMVIALGREDLMRIVSSADELVPETETALLVFGFGGIFSVMYGNFYAALVGLFYLEYLMVLSFGSMIIFTSLSLGLFFYTDLGIVAFGFGFLFANFAACSVGFVALFGIKYNREKYNLYVCPKKLSEEEASEQADWRAAFRASISWLWGQSATFATKGFLATILVLQSGAAPAALYLILVSLTGLTSTIADSLSYIATVLGPRLVGVGDSNPNPDYTGFMAFATFALRSTSLWSGALCILYILTGESLLLASGRDVEVIDDQGVPTGDFESEYAPYVTTPIVLMFAFHQLSVGLAIMSEGLLISAHDFTFVGVTSLLSFLFMFVPVMYASYSYNLGVEAYFGAEVGFYFIRAAMTIVRWSCYIKPRMMEGQTLLATRHADGRSTSVDDKFDEEEELEAHLKEKSVQYRAFLFLLCCCQPSKDAQRVLQDLMKSLEDPAPTMDDARKSIRDAPVATSVANPTSASLPLPAEEDDEEEDVQDTLAVDAEAQAVDKQDTKAEDDDDEAEPEQKSDDDEAEPEQKSDDDKDDSDDSDEELPSPSTQA